MHLPIPVTTVHSINMHIRVLMLAVSALTTVSLASALDGIISRAPSTFANSCIQGEDAPSQTFQVWNSGTGVMNYTITDNTTWLSCNPASGASSGEQITITVNYTSSSLTLGTHTATITITSADAANSPQTISVSLVVAAPAPTISLSTAVLNPTNIQGTTASSASFDIWNSGTGVLGYTITKNVSWLNCGPTVGNSTGEQDTITVNYSTANLVEGTYTGNITITDSDATNNPQTILVTLTVGPPLATIDLTPGVFTLTTVQGGDVPSQTFEVWNSGTDLLKYTIVSSETWLYCSPNAGTSTGEHDTINIYFIADTLPAAVDPYTATITISSFGSANGSMTVSIELTVTPPTAEISADPLVITTTCVQGNSTASIPFDVWNSGTGVLSYQISTDAPALMWPDITSGTSTGEHDTIQLGFSTLTKAAGVYTGVVIISSFGSTNGSVLINVTVTITAPVAEISVTPDNLLPSCTQGNSPFPQSFEVWNSGAGTLTYSIAHTGGWIGCGPINGTSTGEHDIITVTYFASSLAVGTYNATITVSSNGATNSPQVIPVTLTITAAVATITVSPNMFVPPWTPGTNAADQTFTITNTGTDILNYTITDNATWLNCVPASGSSTGESDTITVKYTTSLLAPGTYYGVITIKGNATNTPVTIQVTLTCFDVFPPVVTITSPTTNPTLVIKSVTPLVDLAGTAIDDSGNISSVNWTNDTGGNGACTGTTNWSVSGIGLVIGPNNITISAMDPDGNEGSDTITIIYSDDFVAPEASVSTITLEGTAFNESPNNYEIPTLLVNGTTVITTAGTWAVTDIPLTGVTTTINIFGTDASLNTRQVQLDITK